MKNRSVQKLAIAGAFCALAVVGSMFLTFPVFGSKCAPVQHMVNILCAVFLGPWYGCASAFLCGVMRMMTGRTIQAVAGAVFGPILGGLLWQKTGNVYLVFVGEVVGTGFCGAMAAYPLMKWFYALDAQSPFYYIPFYTPSAVVGAAMGVAAVLILKRGGVLDRLLAMLDGGER